MSVEIRPCVKSLTEEGVCCVTGCTTPATLAVLAEQGDDYIEHIRCPIHEGQGINLLAVKPLHLSPLGKGKP